MGGGGGGGGGGGAEWKRELEAEMAVVDQMEMMDFMPGADTAKAKEQAVEDDSAKAEVMTELRKVKEKLKAELAEELKLVDEEISTSAVTSASSEVKFESDTRSTV